MYYFIAKMPDKQRAFYCYNCGYEKCAPLHRSGPCIKGHYVVHFILSGKGRYLTDGIEHHLKAGEGFLIIPNCIHMYEADPDDPWEYFWVDFGGEQVDSLLKERGLGPENKIFHYYNYEKYKNVILEMQKVFEEKPVDTEAVLGYTYILLAQIPKVNNGTKDVNHHISLALDYIHANYSYKITVDDLSRHLGLNRSYLYRLFMKHLGISPQKAIHDYRLERASSLLNSGKHSITEVAYSCGFIDLSHFSSAYKRKFGITPRQELSSVESKKTE